MTTKQDPPHVKDGVIAYNVDDEDFVGNFWGCCKKLQQRYVFIFLSMIGSMVHTVMGVSMSVVIVAMVKNHPYPSKLNENNTVAPRVCPANHLDQIADYEIASSVPIGGDFDWDEMTQGYILTAGSFGAVASGLIGARIAEIWSPKMVYGILNVAGSLCNLLMPVAAKWDVAALITLRVIQGIFHGPGNAIHSILLSVWAPPDERTKLGGIYYSGTAFGTIISMFLTGILITAFSWEAVFYIYGVVSLIWVVTWFLFIYDSPKKHPGISQEEKEYILSSVSKDDEVVYPVPWLDILTSPPVWAHMAMMCGNVWIMFILMTEIPTYLKNILHYDTRKTGYVAALPMVSLFVGCIFFALLSQWLRRREYLTHMGAYKVFNAISTFGPAATLMAITQMGCDSSSIVILLVITSGLNAAFIGGSVYNLIDLGINFTGTTSGISWMATQIITILSPIITSAIINNNQTVSTWSLVFYISAGVAILPYIVFFLFGSVEEQTWNKPVTTSEKNLTFNEVKHVETGLRS